MTLFIRHVMKSTVVPINVPPQTQNRGISAQVKVKHTRVVYHPGKDGH